MDKGHVAAYRQRGDVELVAIADVSADRRAAAAAAWPKRAHLRRSRGAVRRRGGPARLRRHRDPAQRSRDRHARRAGRRPARAVREAAGGDHRRGARDAAPRDPRRARHLPLPQLQARAGHQGGARRDRIGPDRQGPPGDAADLPRHARQGRPRLADRLAARASLFGRRHRDGPRQPHVLPGVRVAARLPDGDHRARGRRWARTTPKTTSPAACASRPASRRPTCRGTRACAR